MKTEYLTVKEVARKLRVSGPTVQSYIRELKLKAIKLGRQYLIKEDDLVDFVGRPR